MMFEEVETETETETEQEDELVSRRDAAAGGLTFKWWLSDQAANDDELAGPYASLYRIADDARFPVHYNFDAYTEIFKSHLTTDKAATLTEILIQAEAEWRVDISIKQDARESLGMSRDPVGKKRSLMPGTLPDVRCAYTFRSGNVCGKVSVPGSARCEAHGGALLDPQVRHSMLMVAYAKVIENTEVAVQALVDVCQTGRSEIARVQAAKEILDRAGISPEIRVTVQSEDNAEDRIYRLKQQLDKTRERLNASAVEATAVAVASISAPNETPALPAIVDEEELATIVEPEPVEAEIVAEPEPEIIYGEVL